MRHHLLTTLGLGLSMVAATAAIATSAGAVTPSGGTRHAAAPVRPSFVCGGNLSDPDSLVAVNSQINPASMSTYDSKGSEAFEVPATGCTISSVFVVGRLVGAGPVSHVRLVVQASASGGIPHPTGANLAPGNLNVPVSGCSGTGCNLTVNLLNPVSFTSAQAGQYIWITVQARMNPNTAGRWYWEAAKFGDAQDAAWRNQGGAWGCPGGGWQHVGAGENTNGTCFASVKGLLMDLT